MGGPGKILQMLIVRNYFDEINAFSDSLEIEIFTDKNCIIEYHLTALEKGCGHCKVLTCAHENCDPQF